jgi:hypothetical protein
MNTINLAHLPAGTSIEFLTWVIDNRVGNWEQLMLSIARHEYWYKKEIPFECSDEEATLIILRWS